MIHWMNELESKLVLDIISLALEAKKKIMLERKNYENTILLRFTFRV